MFYSFPLSRKWNVQGVGISKFDISLLGQNNTLLTFYHSWRDLHLLCAARKLIECRVNLTLAWTELGPADSCFLLFPRKKLGICFNCYQSNYFSELSVLGVFYCFARKLHHHNTAFMNRNIRQVGAELC